jgi:hypothetical protein
MTFKLYIGIDYSGAKTPQSRLRGLQVFAAKEGQPECVRNPYAPMGNHWNWSRIEIAHWLIELAQTDEKFIVGIDHGFSLPQTYFQRYRLGNWDEFLTDFTGHWPTHKPGITVDSILNNNPQRIGNSHEFRLCERWTSSAKSCFLFNVQGQVAKSTHAGIPFLRLIRQRLGGDIHCWPFDGWSLPGEKSVIAEVYPSIFRNRYPKDGRDSDEQDAYAIARWLKDTCEGGFLGRYLEPPLLSGEKVKATLEGWILGIA